MNKVQFKLKKFMDKKVLFILTGGRHVQGILHSFDPFMNLVMGKNNIDMVIIQGHSIRMLEDLEQD
ncbi:small nuclear ribonucleoprotein G-like [Hemiscyllium ocellatum]|uniref:small nuclear ribonucleoprotein G-like n=1 Tax=Hemiscyllium ocellatum TaxID=170820 RepID=UPI002966F4E1|nr:small nuclear ribonucleoprotein G-like [Hemiscyllium ocellatum]